jgi:hypothetical protein
MRSTLIALSMLNRVDDFALILCRPCGSSAETVGAGWRGMHFETIDLVVEGHLALHGQPVDEVVDRLGAVARPVVDSLRFATRGTIPRARATSAGNGICRPSVGGPTRTMSPLALLSGDFRPWT